MKMYVIICIFDDGSIKVLDMNISREHLETEKQRLDQSEEGYRMKNIQFLEDELKKYPNNSFIADEITIAKLKKQKYFVKQIAFID